MEIKKKLKETKEKAQNWWDEHKDVVKAGALVCMTAELCAVVGEKVGHEQGVKEVENRNAYRMGRDIFSGCAPGEYVLVLRGDEDDSFRVAVQRKDLPELIESGFVEYSEDLDPYLDKSEEEGA